MTAFLPRQRRVLAAICLLAGSAAAQTALFDHHGTVANEFLGSAACVAGDLNGDGIADLVERDIAPAAGWRLRAFSGFDGSTLWVHAMPGSSPLGGVVSADPRGPFPAGDVNGDGKCDVFAGSEYTSGTVEMISGADGSVIWSLTPSFTTGYSAEGAGPDFNGDGIGDVLLTSIDPWSGWGYSQVRSGSNGAPIASLNLYGGYHTWTALIPDATGDGFADVLSSQSASIYTGPSMTLVHAFTGSPPPPGVDVHIGLSGTPGDVNGDGLADLAISQFYSYSPWYPPPHPPLPPQSTKIVAGGSWALLYEVSGASVCGAGGAVASLGDLDGDGRPEFSLSVVGASTSLGGASILSGATGAVIWSSPSSTNDVMSISRCVDLDQDGHPETILLEAYDDTVATDAGRLRVVSWATPASASVTNLGGACGQSSGSLSVGLPRIGTSCSIGLSGCVPLKSGNLAVDVAPDVTTVLSNGCVGHLNLAHYSSWTLMPVVTDASGGFAFNVVVPSIPLAAGTIVTLQAVLFPTASPLGFDISNGVRAVLGY